MIFYVLATNGTGRQNARLSADVLGKKDTRVD